MEGTVPGSSCPPPNSVGPSRVLEVTSLGGRTRSDTNEAGRGWPFSLDCFDPDLDDEADIAHAFKEFEEVQLAKSTSLFALKTSETWQDSQASYLNDRQSLALLSSREQATAGLELYAVSRLTKDAQSRATLAERGRLHVSPQTFRCLMATRHVPVAFIAALSRPYQVCGTGFRKETPHVWDYWCMIPVRAVINCQVQAKDHTKSTAGSNQMDPFHYIHLSGVRADIRGSHIGLFIRTDIETGKTSVIIVNLLDNRLRGLIEEPLRRVKGAIQRRSGVPDSTMSRYFVHHIYLSSVLRWWNNVLLSFNQQLVMHEKQLQMEIASETSAFSEGSKEINTALHIMAAHLHRYKSELQRVEYILSELSSPRFDKMLGQAGNENTGDEDRLKNEKLMSQLKAIGSFADEMERKIQNILTLLFNQIQATNDKTLQAILKAAQADTRLSQQLALQSHELTISMKNDSIAMKSIAVVTMLFLPGTSFAAILSMPFFNQTAVMTTPSYVWIWVILTVAFTIVAFGIFVSIIRRQQQVIDEEKGDEDTDSPVAAADIPLQTLPQSGSGATTGP